MSVLIALLTAAVLVLPVRADVVWEPEPQKGSGLLAAGLVVAVVAVTALLILFFRRRKK